MTRLLVPLTLASLALAASTIAPHAFSRAGTAGVTPAKWDAERALLSSISSSDPVATTVDVAPLQQLLEQNGELELAATWSRICLLAAALREQQGLPSLEETKLRVNGLAEIHKLAQSIDQTNGNEGASGEVTSLLANRLELWTDVLTGLRAATAAEESLAANLPGVVVTRLAAGDDSETTAGLVQFVQQLNAHRELIAQYRDHEELCHFSRSSDIVRFWREYLTMVKVDLDSGRAARLASFLSGIVSAEPALDSDCAATYDRRAEMVRLGTAVGSLEAVLLRTVDDRQTLEQRATYASRLAEIFSSVPAVVLQLEALADDWLLAACAEKPVPRMARNYQEAVTDKTSRIILGQFDVHPESERAWIWRGTKRTPVWLFGTELPEEEAKTTIFIVQPPRSPLIVSAPREFNQARSDLLSNLRSPESWEKFVKTCERLEVDADVLRHVIATGTSHQTRAASAERREWPVVVPPEWQQDYEDLSFETELLAAEKILDVFPKLQQVWQRAADTP